MDRWTLSDSWVPLLSVCYPFSLIGGAIHVLVPGGHSKDSNGCQRMKGIPLLDWTFFDSAGSKHVGNTSRLQTQLGIAHCIIYTLNTIL